MLKHLRYIAIALIVASCGSRDGSFRLEGQFKNLNQGDFYVINYDRGTKDTIHVKDGRFVYEALLRDTVTLSILFPNYSELPVFASPGAKLKMVGDVSHLKETEIKGTEENDEMTAFRLNASKLTPPEAIAAAEAHINEHPASAVSLYLLQRYFLSQQNTDYARAYKLCNTISKAAHEVNPSSPVAIKAAQLIQPLSSLKNYREKGKLHSFKATDTKGRTVTNATLTAEVNVIYVWSAWNYESQNAQRQLRRLWKDHKGRMNLLAICLDADEKESKNIVERDSITWSNVCDGKLWQSPIMKQLGIASLPANYITDSKGHILACNLDTPALRKKISDLLSE